MNVETLAPSLELLTQEYVLVQAWKKTASYIRYHNWYADTLELDRAAVNLPQFLGRLAGRFHAHEDWTSDPIRIVPAPKSQAWRVTEDAGWAPVDNNAGGVSLRPLAHVSLQDQVASTAMMLCLADRVESAQGDTRGSLTDNAQRRRVVSYGNRLFCDGENDNLRHRWGSSKLYRSYFQDYRSFLSRPDVVAEKVSGLGEIDLEGLADLGSIPDGHQVVIVHSDLRQFFDRVSPDFLAKSLGALALPEDDPAFFVLLRRLLNWEWHQKDTNEVESYSRQAGLESFRSVALPQGLVSAGFFSNVGLLAFDNAVRASFGSEIRSNLLLHDVCRYVDDLRIVVSVPQEADLRQIEKQVVAWLQGLLDIRAPGCLISEAKTKAAMFRGDQRPIVRQSRKMERIQGAVSMGFDALGGEDILDAVQGLIRSQQRYSEQRLGLSGWQLSPIPDVRDSTVSRFAAARFRTTYRSLRPMLEEGHRVGVIEDESASDAMGELSRVIRAQDDLDDEARAFALGLIENWVEDPSNVRLLRIALDLWPAADVLSDVLDLLKPFTIPGGWRKGPRRVAWYCLAEILRAGAIETGIVESDESLPNGVDVGAYRDVLLQEALRLLELPSPSLPWYVKQQALLFVAVHGPGLAPFKSKGNSPEVAHYRELILFLRGDARFHHGGNSATLAILARRSFLGRQKAIELIRGRLPISKMDEIAERDPSFALEVFADDSKRSWESSLSPRLRDDLSLGNYPGGLGELSLAELVLAGGQRHALRDERALLSFCSKFLAQLTAAKEMMVVTPSEVLLTLDDDSKELLKVRLRPSRVSSEGSMYRPPAWCDETERWRFQLGYLIRFILTARPDFTRSVRAPHWKEEEQIYRVPESHWYQRLYGLYSGHAAYGDDWLPITDWVEALLFSLLRWPGCLESNAVPELHGPDAAQALIDARSVQLNRDQGASESVLLLRLPVPRPDGSKLKRPIRACIAQTVLPQPGSDFPSAENATKDALTFSDRTLRRRHRNHIAATLAAVEAMLNLRETHKGRDGRLDWLILPELAVHPDDVRTHLLPFARTHKTIILAGLTYEEIFAGEPLVNSALWVIPRWTRAQGLQISMVRQGKKYLSPEEEKFNEASDLLQGFRPCQWLIGYEWSHADQDRPLWLTGSICYDATDLALAADLRNHSDVFAISALNKDVRTFDQMALALHYHMFQFVILANNGLFGGSNAYVPYRKDYQRQVFHLHGQPQATIGFLEIDDIESFLRRKDDAKVVSAGSESANRWKFPPAGM